MKISRRAAGYENFWQHLRLVWLTSARVTLSKGIAVDLS
jgi:hypothetical protein